MEDDLAFEEPDPIPRKRLSERHIVIEQENDWLKFRVDELLKSNEELMAVNEKYKQENAWMRNEWENDCIKIRILEAQMEVVRLIFGGKNNG